MVGAQLAGFYQLTYGRARGLQMSWGINMALNGMTGAQLTWLANITDGGMYGFQMALLNYNRGPFMRGASVGLVNINRGSVNGAQIGMVNLAENGPDSGTRSHGARIGMVNVDRSSIPLQGAMIGLVNIGGTIDGAQVGLVNVADDVKGAQVGIVNFARKNSGASIGFFPLALDGYIRGAMWWSDSSYLNLGAKLGTHHFYIVLGAGLTRDRDTGDHRIYTSTFGLGGHITPTSTGPLFFDIDVVGTARMSKNSWEDDDRDLNTLRLQVGWQVARHLAVVAGPTVNVQVAKDAVDRVPRMVGRMEKVWHHDGYTVRLYPGMVAGLQF
jgi:hypothetical protein